MLFLISLLIGLVCGGMIGGLVLLVANRMPVSRPHLDVSVATTQQQASGHWI
ncbi:hypothetical protein [Deinococcus roseus]|uniref:Uncharacterized protein n=1 Tax=Deinococcus roseus TaxID=392414 RepID=A0ABQ2DHA2_9DEIO|nr:hypothetical protein [Deinococcus roseus]GGJ57597.1 hypothetical protein GCM10008938_49600 [Deinococcus roseus]